MNTELLKINNRLHFLPGLSPVYMGGLNAAPEEVHYHQIFTPQPVTSHLLDGFLLPSPTCRVWSVCCVHSRFIPLPLESSGTRGMTEKAEKQRVHLDLSFEAVLLLCWLQV